MSPSPTAIHFKQSPFAQWFWGFCSVFFVGIASAGAALITSGGAPQRLGLITGLMSLLILGLAVYCVRAMLRARGEVVVDESGVWWMVGRRPPTSIAWSDVQSLRADDLMQRLIVSDRTSRRTIKMEYQLDRFADLRAFVLAHTADSARWRPAPTATFHKSWVLVAVNVAADALFLTLGVAAVARGQGMLGLCLLGLFVWLVAAARNTPLRVTVRADRVDIIYLLRRKVLPIGDITAATLADRVDGNGNSRTDVVLSTTRQGVFKFSLFSEGSLALLQALHHAIDRAPQGRPVTGSRA